MEHGDSEINNEEGSGGDAAQSRRRRLSSSSSSDSSSGSDRPRKVPRREKSVSDLQFEFLSQQVTFLTNLLMHDKNSVPRTTSTPLTLQTGTMDTTAATAATPATSAVATATTGPTATGSASTAPDMIPVALNTPLTTAAVTSDSFLRPPTEVQQERQIQLTDFSTTVKDPVYVKANETHLNKLSEIQRFKSNDWNSIRFSETQKKYVASPGFIELNLNDELRRFGSATSIEDSRLHLLERTFAALTNALLTQKDELRSSLQTIIDWSSDKDTTLTPKTLFDKIESAFNKESNYIKVTDDIVQILCGRRADCVQSRRDILLKRIPEEYHSSALQKIPPNSEFLFDDSMLGTYIQKIGGADKLATQAPLAGPSKDPPRYYGPNVSRPKPDQHKQPTQKFFQSTQPSKKGKGRGKSSSGKRSSSDKGRSHQNQRGNKTNSSSFRNKYNA